MTARVGFGQVLALRLGSGAQAPAEARAAVDALSLGLSRRQRYDLRLGVSELVANSVVHGKCDRPEDPVDVSISVSSASIRCEVGDQGPGFGPEARLASGGLGLAMVERFAARWGIGEGGRRVWFELDRAG